MPPPSPETEKPTSTVHVGERFSHALACWLEWLEHNKGRSARTVAKYAGYLDRLAAWVRSPPDDPRMRPTAALDDALDVTPADLDVFTGLYAHSIGMTPRSRRPLIAAVRGFYAWCSGVGHVQVDPSERVVYPSFGRPLPIAASIGDAERMLMAPNIETFTGLRDAAMIAILIGCGLRVSGLIAMNESSLLWVTGDQGDELAIKVTEKGKKDRIVPVPSEAALLLRAYLGHPDLSEINRDLDADRVLWVTQNNHRVPAHEYHGQARRIAARTIGQMLDRYGKRAGVPKAHRHPHAFRHLYGTELTESDVTTLQVQGLMGHANPKDSEIYTRLATRKLREAVDRANPLAKMRAPLLDSLRGISTAQRKGRASASNRRL